MGNNHASRLNSHSVQALDFTFYEDACLHDPEVKKVDNKFKDHTDNVINALAQGVGDNGISCDSLKEVTTSLLDLDHEVTQVILNYKYDVWENKELFELVRDFFENSLSTLEFCSATESSIKRARDNQLMLNLALLMPKDRDPTPTEVDEIQKELNAFRDAGNPFDEQFVSKFQAVRVRHNLMLEKIMAKKKDFDRKLKSIKLWAKVSSVIFAAVMGAILICSVVAAAIAAPPIAGALAAVVSVVPLGAVGSWVKSLWNGYEREIESQKDVLLSMNVGTVVAIVELENINGLVGDLNIKLESIAASIRFTDDHRDVVALTLVIKEIRQKREYVVTKLDDLQKHIDKVGRRTRQAREAVLHKISQRQDRRN